MVLMQKSVGGWGSLQNMMSRGCKFGRKKKKKRAPGELPPFTHL